MKRHDTNMIWVATCVALGATGGMMGLTSAFADGDRKTESVIGTNMILPYKGYIMQDSDGLTGTQTVRFELYESATGGTRVWNSERDVRAVDGSFSIALGEVNALNDAVLDAERLWLSMTIVLAGDGEVALSGRQAIEVTPYAVWSKNAATHDVAGSLVVGGDLEVAELVTVPGVTALGGFETDDATSSAGTFSAPTIFADTGSFGSATVSGQIDARGTFTANGSTISLGSGTGNTVTVTGTLLVSNDIQVNNDIDIVGMSTIEATQDLDFHYSTSSGTYMTMSSAGALDIHKNTVVGGQFAHGSGSSLDVTSLTDIGGALSMGGALNVTGELEHGTNCPGSPLGNVDSHGARLCVYKVTGSYNWYSAAYQCFNQHGAELCSMAELRRARANPISGTFDTGYWMRDRLSDTDSAVTNSTDASVFDNDSGRSNTQSGGYCCRIVSDT